MAQLSGWMKLCPLAACLKEAPRIGRSFVMDEKQIPGGAILTSDLRQVAIRLERGQEGRTLERELASDSSDESGVGF